MELSYARNALKKSISSVTAVVKSTLMTNWYGYMTAFIPTEAFMFVKAALITITISATNVKSILPAPISGQMIMAIVSVMDVMKGIIM